MPILQALLCFVLVALPTGNGIRIPARLVKNSLSTAKPERGHVAANNGHIINNDDLHLGGASNKTSTEISGDQGNTTRDHAGLRPRMVWKSLKVKVTEILVQLRIGASHCLLGDHYVAFLPRDTTVDVIAKLVLEPLFFHPKHGVTLQRKASRLLLFLYDTSKKAQAIFRISALGAWGLQFQKQFGRGLEVFFLPTLLYAVYMNCIYFVAAKTQHG
ncbi:unknown protein [Seminavis robusta]|uniref:Uncharacterized protein n=1 Tax=Seminavis robusta TaxID=568900 RepID=A0A9N8H7J5_9STRA|nr:unknown protein [Seminavis robusta]|eukprot:Sro142_g066240.1 n/a (216) ;mRNA; r:58344-58991